MIIFLICIAPATGFTKISTRKVVQWNRWEHVLTAQIKHDGKLAGVEIIFTGPEGKTFSSVAFTDDGMTYRFRAAFPSPGLWRWKSTCNNTQDAGLHNISGNVKVKQYHGKNPLYLHGDLKISDNRRYLVHADGTPFLWMGDTGWLVALKSTMEEWTEYVDNRLQQKFSALQISPIGLVNKKMISAKPAVSFKEDGTPDPVFWRDFENKIAYANDNGLIVLLVGVGNVWNELFERNPVNQSFASYLTARLAGHMVIFSPSFDELFDAGNNKIAEDLDKYTTHLVTQHPGTNYEANMKYPVAPAIDFAGMQSGHHNGDIIKAYRAARTWTLDLWNKKPVKPVIEIEAMYDGYGHDNAKNWREKDARKLGWIAWLSGAKGYTYGAGDSPPKVKIGAGGIWRFNNDTSAYDHWRKSIKWPSAGQMTIMRNFFKSIEWWNLVPAHELVQNQADDETKKMVVSKSVKGDLVVGYLPDNEMIELDMKDLSVEYKGKWFNPNTGEYISIEGPVRYSAETVFTRPMGWEDAVLVLMK